MSAPTPAQKRRIAREKAIADGRIAGPQDRRSTAGGAPVTEEDIEAAKAKRAREEMDKFDPTPLGAEVRVIEYDDMEFEVSFAEYDTWDRGNRKGAAAEEVLDPHDESRDEHAVMSDVERQLKTFLGPEGFEAALDACDEKYSYISKRWVIGLLREILRHPDLGN